MLFRSIGVLFSALPVLVYQGSISMLASLVEPVLTAPVLNNVTALGGILIAALGLNLLKVTDIRVANLLPGLLLVPVIMAILSLF